MLRKKTTYILIFLNLLLIVGVFVLVKLFIAIETPPPKEPPTFTESLDEFQDELSQLIAGIEEKEGTPVEEVSTGVPVVHSYIGKIVQIEEGVVVLALDALENVLSEDTVVQVLLDKATPVFERQGDEDTEVSQTTLTIGERIFVKSSENISGKGTFAVEKIVILAP